MSEAERLNKLEKALRGMGESQTHNSLKHYVAHILASRGWNVEVDQVRKEGWSARHNRPVTYRPDVYATKGNRTLWVEVDGPKYHNTKIDKCQAADIHDKYPEIEYREFEFFQLRKMPQETICEELNV